MLLISFFFRIAQDKCRGVILEVFDMVVSGSGYTDSVSDYKFDGFSLPPFWEIKDYVDIITYFLCVKSKYLKKWIKVYVYTHLAQE